MNHRIVRFLLTFIAAITIVSPLWAGGSSLRFFGNGTGDIDRVKVQISPQVPADVGASDFTIEFWMKANPGDNNSGNCVTGSDGWMNGNIIFDRDVLGNGDFGEYGISLFNDGIAFGVNNGTTGDGICGTSNVADGFWHHVAVTRRFSDGRLELFVDGVREASLDGPDGDLSYNDSHSNPDPNDPFLVIGAQKRDDSGSLSYNGWIDEIRISNNLRYDNTTEFTRPSANFTSDGNTSALYHFDEGSANIINDSSGAGTSDGVRNFGGSPAGPIWSPDKTPLGPLDQNPPSDFFQSLITSGLSSPVAITTPPDGTNRLFITEQPGVISFWNGSALIEFMDIQNIVNFGGEQGLLSTAFHPDYANNGYFYVYFTNNNGDNEVDRFNVMSGDPNKGDPASRVIILPIAHPGQSNHNGGQLQFGPDGYLYIGTGDGGGGGDPDENGQDINALLGKILRIDVGDGTPPYSIPPDNPYAGGTPGLDEIWAIGVRNPWRYGFDRVTGDQIIADVGQDSWEEVDFQAFGTPGGVNWGWDDREGAHCFEPMSGCQTAGRTDPIMEYSHNFGCSVSGGYRYRGTAIPQIYGKYFLGDYCSGSVWQSTQSGNGSWSLGNSLSTGFNISGFGEDANGEMYIINLNGAVYKFTGTDANLALTVTDNPDPVFQNTTLTYTLTVTNNGPKTANSVVLVDELPASVTFISSSNGNCVHNNGIVTCNLNNMNNGASIQFTIDVMPTTLGPINNYTIVSANENDPDSTNNSDTETTQVIALTGTELALTKSDSVDPVPVGGNLSYTIQVTNNGPEDATGVTVTDTLPGTVTFVSASPGCSEASGTVTCNIGNLDAGSNVSVQIDVTPTQAGTISNTATVTGNETDPFPGNNSDTEDTVVMPPSADLALTKSDSADPVNIGVNFTYTIQITNNGPEDATGVTVTDTLPGTVTFVSASPGCTEASGTVTCDIGNLAATASISVQIDVTPTAAGTISNTATVSGNENDPNSANNSDTEDTRIVDPNACMFCDDFNDGTLDPNWTYIRNSSFWSEDGTSLIGTNTRKTTAVATVFAGCLTCYAETTMRTAGGAGNRLWLLHHYVNKFNTVELLMKEENDRWVLKHRVNGRVVAKQKYLMPIDPNTDYIVRITYDGTNYTASVNGTPLSPPLTPGGTVTQGTAGLRVKGTTGTFDRIEIN
jgi:uncharacterized repeat protein (TIGR01451 family)